MTSDRISDAMFRLNGVRKALNRAEAFANEYEFDSDEGCHTPSDLERMLMIDMLNGLFDDELFVSILTELQDTRARSAEPVAWRYRDHDINGEPWSWSYCDTKPAEHSEVQPLYAVPPSPMPAVPDGEHDEDDLASDDRWNSGVNYAIERLCGVFGIDPATINWDAATETLDGDVMSVLCNVLVAAYGEDWSSNELDTVKIRSALAAPPAPQAETAPDVVGKSEAWMRDTAMNVMLATEVEEAERILAAALRQPVQVTDDMVERLGAHKSWSLGLHDKVYGDDDDKPTHGNWVVWEETGSINDREWLVKGYGPTPLAALTAALSVGGKQPLPSPSEAE